MPFIKRRDDAPEGFFTIEAAGLRWLAVPGGVRVAEILDESDTGLVLEHVTRVSPTPQAAEEFGRRLAVTHDAGAPAFGSPPPGVNRDGFIGNAPLTLRPSATWGAFYARERVLPYARLAARQGALAEGGLVLIDRLCARLAAGEFDDSAPPARIHGDLWSGNVLYDTAGAVLIDPAAHGGHRVTDLAMLALFGAPHLERTLAAYAEASERLPDRWRDLVRLHQLHPLLIHAVLFGGGYGAQAVQAARHYA